MQSTMTEKQFREKVKQAIGNPTWSVADTVLPILAEAGLEFAPEQVPLPERLEMVGRMVLFDRDTPGRETTATENQIATALIYQHARNHPCSKFNVEVLSLAVARYNAYPGLREAAEGLVKAIDNGHGGLEERWHEKLRAELAKGPK